MNIWMVSGSQHLYGEETLKQVASHTKEIAGYLNDSGSIPAPVLFKGIITTPGEISAFFQQANADDNCGGIILWMHTFSPSKMWINGLKGNRKPLVHLHTQYNRDIPWEKIDMDFMNLNQSAHGGREHGFIQTRMHIDRKVIVGYWQEERVLRQLDSWIRAAAGVFEMQGARIARFGDNMRDVAVTEGDKVDAQIQFGYNVYGYGIGDLLDRINQVREGEIDALIEEYIDEYQVAEELLPGGAKAQSLREAARIELGLEGFLTEGDFCAFTDTFENLTGLKQLPGLAVQRLMAKGYGFGAEGDWKTAALVRTLKIMARGKEGGTSFMEDYTYHLDPAQPLVLGAHMLEVCPSIAGAGKPRLEIHPLSIGGKEDPVRMVFNVSGGDALNASMVDMGNRHRLIVNTIRTVDVDKELPKLPVARVVWEAKPDLPTAAGAWILAGGAHHTAYSKDVTPEILQDWAEMVGIELLMIDENTRMSEFKKELKWNELYYSLKALNL